MTSSPESGELKAIERLQAMADKREQGVQPDKRRHIGDDFDEADARMWATVPGVRLDDLQALLARARTPDPKIDALVSDADLASRPSTDVLVEAPRVFLDCDGVLADFDKAGMRSFGMPPREAEKLVGSAEFWRQLEEEGNFYRRLPLMHDAMELYNGVKHLNPTILTGCPRGDWAQAQKIAWAAEHFPGVPIITCRSADKRNHAKPGDVLIDDWPQHRHRWIEMGGVFISHHDAASSLAALWAHYPALATFRETDRG